MVPVYGTDICLIWNWSTSKPKKKQSFWSKTKNCLLMDIFGTEKYQKFKLPLIMRNELIILKSSNIGFRSFILLWLNWKNSSMNFTIIMISHGCKKSFTKGFVYSKIDIELWIVYSLPRVDNSWLFENLKNYASLLNNMRCSHQRRPTFQCIILSQILFSQCKWCMERSKKLGRC